MARKPARRIFCVSVEHFKLRNQSGSLLSICCIKQLAEDNSEKFPLVSKTILEDIYVDDILTGSNDLNKLKTRCNNIYSILQSASLTLRKWNSNCSEVISNQTLSCTWNYVNSKESPAELTKEELCLKFFCAEMWWTEPVFLKLPQNVWPLTEFSISS
nr:unnamed protein product [Callosobruchus analis]